MKKIGLTIIFIFTFIFLNTITVHAVYNPIPGQPLTFKHYFIMRDNASVPPLTYLTTITPEDDLANNIIAGPTPKNGEDINTMIANVVYQNNSTTYSTPQAGDEDIVLNSGEKYAKAQEIVHLDMVEFESPGIYRYKIAGTKDPTRSSDGISQCIPLYLDVHVINTTSGLAIASTFLHLTTSNEKVNSVSDTYTSRDIKLINNVTGNLGNKDLDFKYTLKVIGDHADKIYKVISSTGTQQTITSGGTVDFNLKHTQELSIYGLSENDNFQIVQEKADFYDTSFVIDYDPRVVGLDTTTKVMGKNDRLVVYTNHYNKDTPTTGIIMNYTPYLIAILCSLSFGYVFIYRKHKKVNNK